MDKNFKVKFEKTQGLHEKKNNFPGLIKKQDLGRKLKKWQHWLYTF